MTFRKNDRVHHPVFGLGTVTDVGEDGRVEIQFDNIDQKQIALKYAYLSLISPEEEAKLNAENQYHIGDTFAQPDHEDEHAHGSHWSIFADDVAAFLGETLPSALNHGVTVPCWGNNHPAPFVLPMDEPKAVNLTWPIPRQGMMSVIQINGKSGLNECISTYPWISEGVQHRIRLEKVFPWHNRLEAQIEVSIGSMVITFFDALYSQHKAFYHAGQYYQFIMTGFVYSCSVIEPKPILISNPEIIRTMREIEQKDKSELTPISIETKGMAVLIPIDDCDRDDYQFQSPVKSVMETELFGKKTWRIRSTVLRSIDNNDDIDIDIYVTEKALQGNKIPEKGDSIAGTLWLQGYLWYPEQSFYDAHQEFSKLFLP